MPYDDFRDFIRSPLGQLASHKSRMRRQLLLGIRGPLETKKSRTPDSVARVQVHIDKQMQAVGRKRAFTVPVALQIDFWASAPNPPDVHTLAKHYLDVLQKPEPKSGIKRSRLLLADDRLVQVLICNYHLDKPESAGAHFRIATLTDFAREMDLYRRIRLGRFDGLNGQRRKDWTGRDEEQDEDRLREALQDHKKLVDSRPLLEAKWGSDIAEFYRTDRQRDVQELMLKRREPRPEDLAAIYTPHVGRSASSDPLSGIMLASASMIKEYFSHALVSVELAAPAVRQGDTDVFKAKVREALKKLRQDQPLMFPLLTTMGITVLYLPPVNGQRSDLDNLARRIVPFVHQELRPPSHIVHTLNVEKMTGDVRKSYEAQLEQLKRTPKYHLTRYQVLWLPRHKGDPKEGTVRLMLHGGRGYWGPWQEADSAISRWERDVRDDREWRM